VNRRQQWIGARMATLVGVLGVGTMEYQNGGLTPATKDRAATLLTELIPIRLCWTDFDQIARKHGLAVMREHCAVNLLELDDAYLNKWIDVALGLMTAIAKKALN
jgi:hypothetical protein